MTTGDTTGIGMPNTHRPRSDEGEGTSGPVLPVTPPTSNGRSPNPARNDHRPNVSSGPRRGSVRHHTRGVTRGDTTDRRGALVPKGRKAAPGPTLHPRGAIVCRQSSRRELLNHAFELGRKRVPVHGQYTRKYGIVANLQLHRRLRESHGSARDCKIHPFRAKDRRPARQARTGSPDGIIQNFRASAR